MNYQKLLVAGNVTQDAERKTSKQGDVTYTTFSVAVNDRQERVTFFPIILFGQLGDILTQYITKGRQILVEGRVNISEKGYFSVIADRIELGVVPKASTNNVDSDN